MKGKEKLDVFSKYYYKLITRDIPRIDAYAAAEKYYKRKHGQRAYKNYKTFLVTHRRYFHQRKQ